MAGRGRGIALFRQLQKIQDEPQEDPEDDNKHEVESISTFVPPMPFPTTLKVAAEVAESECSASEAQKSTESEFLLPIRGRGMLTNKSFLVKEHDEDKTSSSKSQEIHSGSTPRLFTLGRGMIKSSGRETASDPSASSHEKPTKESIESMTEKLLIIEEATGGDENVKTAVEVKDVDQKEPVLRHGVKGEKFSAIANLIRIHCMKDYGIYEYDVRFQPLVDATRIRKELLRKTADTIGTIFQYDGAETIYLPMKLPSQKTKKAVEGDQPTTLLFTFRRQRSLAECCHFYNLLFERIMYNLEFQRIGTKFFDPSAPKMVPQHTLEVWPGYVKTVEEVEGGIMLSLDVSHRVINQRSVYDFIQDCVKNSSRGGSNANWQEKLKKGVIGTIVMTKYNNKTYRIDDIQFDKSPATTFKLKDGSEVSYAQYYQKNYNITIKDMKQPILIHLEKVRVSGEVEKREMMLGIIPELAVLTGLTDDMKNTHVIMKDLATHTKLSPQQRLGSYKEFISRVNGSAKDKQLLEDWGLKLEESPIGVTARLLGEETMIFGGDKKQGIGPQADFTRAATSNAVIEAYDLTNWVMIYDKQDKATADKFVNTMIKICGPTGMRCANAKRSELPNDRIDSYVNAIRKCMSSDPHIQMFVTLFPTLRDDRYAAVKKTLCFEVPCPSQCINTKTLRHENKNRSIIMKILLQINCKLGGSLWGIKIPLNNTMIVGIDTYHEVGNRGKAVSGLVASINASFTRYFSRPHIQQNVKEELVAGLANLLVEALQSYMTYNEKQLPDKIIIYRDGVGDGQLEQVKNVEITQFEKACAMVSKGYKPKITFIVVQKRITLKFFKEMRGQVVNPPPGSVLDSTVTRRYLYDFYLCSQHVREGTTSPTHYVVLRDDNNFEPDIVQRLSYKLTFMYYNWPGAVRVPAPCQYAHKLVTLIGTSVKKPVDNSLCEKLFYL